MTMAEILERTRSGSGAGPEQRPLPPDAETEAEEDGPFLVTPEPRGITARARAHTERAIAVLVDSLNDDDVRIRIAAAKELLDRGWGKTLTMNADQSDRLEAFDDQSLDRAIAILRDLVGSAVESGSGEEPARLAR